MIDGAKASADENTIAFGITLIYDTQQLETRAPERVRAPDRRHRLGAPL
jgi:hypothetical protein